MLSKTTLAASMIAAALGGPTLAQNLDTDLPGGVATGYAPMLKGVAPGYTVTPLFTVGGL